MQPEIKRKLITGTTEVVLGIAIYIFCLISDFSLFTYGALLFIISGGFTLLICGLRILADNAAKKKQEAKDNPATAQATTQVTTQVNTQETTQTNTTNTEQK